MFVVLAFDAGDETCSPWDPAGGLAGVRLFGFERDELLSCSVHCGFT